MKNRNLLLVLLASCTQALSGPLQPAHIASEARWVVHLDTEALLATTVGQTIAREALDPRLAEVASALKLHLNFDFDWRRIRSLTLYGWEYGGPERLRGVLLVDTDLDLTTAFARALEKQAEWGRAQDGDLQLLEGGPQPLYCIKEDLYVALQPGAPAIIGKARRTTLQARQVLVGGAPNLNTAGDLARLAAPAPGEFLLLAARGFAEAAPDTPQTRVLKMSEELRLSLKETGDHVRAALALTTRAAEPALQMQQIVQGMAALGALSQPNNADLQTLIRGLRVAAQDRQLQLELAVPATQLAAKIAEAEQRKRASAP